MKTIYFENVKNKEKFFCNNTKDIKFIDGIEYLRVFKLDTKRDCLVRKDQLIKLGKNLKPIW